jgi:GT2 family glycosyltransferase
MQSELAIVILNYNTCHLLNTYLPSVVKYSEGHRIIFVDNASKDDSVNFVQENYPQIEVIQLEENFGFTGGYNRALKQIDAKYYCLLNTDVEVTQGWIEPIINLMQSDEKIAVCQPKLLSYTEKNKFEYAGAAGGFIDYLGYPFCVGRIFDKIEEDKGQYDQIREIFWASGAAFFIKSELYHQLGGLDENYFAHFEEIDLCWRLKNEGYKIYCNPNSIVYHLGGGTLNKTSPFKTYLNFRNSLLTLYKNLPQNKVDSILRKRKILDFIAALTFLLKRNGEFSSVIKAYKDFKKMKSQYKKSTVETYPTCVFQKSIVIQNKVKLKQRFFEINQRKK